MIRRECEPASLLHKHHAICLRDSDAGFAALAAAFRARGFARVAALTLDARVSFGAQVRAFAAAQVVVLVHGAAMANFLWARPGTVFVEMTPYLKGRTLADKQARQELAPGRGAGQELARVLARRGVGVRHVALPAARSAAARSGGEAAPAACGAWSCYNATTVVELVMRERALLLAGVG